MASATEVAVAEEPSLTLISRRFESHLDELHELLDRYEAVNNATFGTVPKSGEGTATAPSSPGRVGDLNYLLNRFDCLLGNLADEVRRHEKLA
jgi:hypothetical protein